MFSPMSELFDLFKLVLFFSKSPSYSSSVIIDSDSSLTLGSSLLIFFIIVEFYTYYGLASNIVILDLSSFNYDLSL
jgi:hypothetical protein